ncbi:hypothetical protein DAEQUDRAFT_537431 [Daedalea quercina L-15889]|uniref:Uncharacterized protein n=1 Tax=Daedalea quercina L-15889 TaxID=1314783 RepID=A0A165M5Q2_9APHY|nr:hypothetical protein DAEQUDRAFT_537431 [Daedalea quercina L-15889]
MAVLLLTRMTLLIASGLEVTIVGMATASTAHLLVLVITWRHTFTGQKLADAISEKNSMTTLLLRDGSLFFGAILVVDILDIMSTYAKTFKGFGAFPSVMTGILLSRFFLNLRDATDAVGAESRSVPISDIQFSMQNSLGGSIAFNEEDEDEDEDEEDEKSLREAQVEESRTSIGGSIFEAPCLPTAEN